MKIWEWLREQTPATKREKAKHEENLRRWEKNRQTNLRILNSIMNEAPEGAAVVVQTGERYDQVNSFARAEQMKQMLMELYKDLGRVKCAGLYSPDIIAFFVGKITPDDLIEELTVDLIKRYWIFEL